MGWIMQKGAGHSRSFLHLIYADLYFPKENWMISTWV